MDYQFFLREIESPMPHLRAYKQGQCTVLVGQEPFFMGSTRLGWHLSISHPIRYPTWDEIKEARYRLIPPDIDVVMYLPPVNEYVNIHENCFHLWENERRLPYVR